MSTRSIERPHYDADFHLWTEDQAARLRAMAALRPNEPIDWELLAEEVEDLGRSERRACESYVEQIIAHLLKLQFSTLIEPRGHWQGEIANFRSLLEKTLTPSLEQRIRAEIRLRYRTGLKLATARVGYDDQRFAEIAPAEAAYSYEQITGDWWPTRSEA